MCLNLSQTVRITLVALLTCTGSGAFGQVINEDVKLVAKDGYSGDKLGWSIDIDDGVIAISTITSYGDYENVTGWCYLFDAKTGQQLHRLQPTNGHEIDNFGASVAIKNGIVAVGAPSDDSIDTDVGAVYLFDAATGAQLHKLVPDDINSYKYIGLSVAMDDGIVAVGAPLEYDAINQITSGSVYLFDTETGLQVSKITAQDRDQGDWFGHAVAIDNGVMVTTSPFDEGNGQQTGSAYLFDIETGSQIVKFYPNDPMLKYGFGKSVDINDGFVAIDNYLFDTAGNQLLKLQPSDLPKSSNLNGAPSISNGIVAIATDQDIENGEGSGAVYLFDIVTGQQITKLLPQIGAPYDRFGHSVAIDQGVLAVGAINTDLTGAGYAFNISSIICPADLTQDGSVDFFDISEFLSTQPDWNDDTVFDFFDVSDYLAAFTAGCP